VELEVGFTDAPGVFAILEQDGFFDAFKIKFEKDQTLLKLYLQKSLPRSEFILLQGKQLLGKTKRKIEKINLEKLSFCGI
jgi:hypothetical protein